MATCGKTGLYLREMRPRKKHTEADLVTATGAARMSRGKDVQKNMCCMLPGWLDLACCPCSQQHAPNTVLHTSHH